MEEEYKGVKIKVAEGKNERGKFTLSWPGHQPEEISSQYKQGKYILIEAKSFVDSWIEDGYIVLPDSQ